MDTQHHIDLARALAGVPGPLPPSGVIHLAIPHTSRFTIVGNHLAQHPELSLTAIGIGVHIQSLPTGSRVGIKALAARFPEGETTIASALRELEAHGYLRRTRIRLANGRMATRTVFCNQPGAALRDAPGVMAPPPTMTPEPPHAEGPSPTPTPASAPAPAPTPAPAPAPAPEPAFVREGSPAPAWEGSPTPVRPESPAPVRAESLIPVPEEHSPAPLPALVPPRTAPKPPPRPLPQPSRLTPELHRSAAALLADLRRHAPELVLSESDVEHLAPAMAAWLERDAHPEAIRRALTTDLPQPLRHPAKLLRHRLTALLPPPLPGTPELAPVRRTLVIPLQNCDRCDHAFRATSPGHCRGCRSELLEAA